MKKHSSKLFAKFWNSLEVIQMWNQYQYRVSIEQIEAKFDGQVACVFSRVFTSYFFFFFYC